MGQMGGSEVEREEKEKEGYYMHKSSTQKRKFPIRLLLEIVYKVKNIY